MPYVPISSQLEQNMRKAMMGSKSCVFEPTCTFFNGSGYRKEWRTLKMLNIAQDFTGSFGDVIQATILATPDEIRETISHNQDLYCSVVCMPMDTRNMAEATSSDPFILTGRVLLNFKEDMDKMLGANAFGQPDAGTGTTRLQSPDQAAVQYDITFHIIEEDVYNLRNTQMNAILRDTSVEGVLHWVSERMGATSASIMTPNNTQQYTNMVIPPLKSVQDLFPYMQQRYGVFSKGMGYYFTQGKMYVYPKADQDLSTSPTDTVVHLINIPPKNVTGSNAYHNEITSERAIYIASTTETNVISPGAEATENQGNVHVSLQADRLKDNWFTKATNGVVNKVADTITSLSLQNTAANISANTQRVVYDGESSNPYVATSQMAETNMTLMETGWSHAFPRLLEPGQTIYFHYDSHDGQYKIQKGRLQKAMYQSQIQEQGRSPFQGWMTFNAGLEVRLDPDLISESEIQILNP